MPGFLEFFSRHTTEAMCLGLYAALKSKERPKGVAMSHVSYMASGGADYKKSRIRKP